MKHLTSAELLARTKTLVAEERRATLSLIEHLEEIQARRLYAELDYGSLWEFATHFLGLSEGAAQRRISAMRLVHDVPEAKAALASGALSLSNAAKVQGFRQSECKLGRRPDALKLVEAVKGCSQRECEKKLFDISPESLPREKERVVSAGGERELKVVITAGLYDKLQRLKGLLAHSMPDASYSELLEFMTDKVLGDLEKRKGISLEPKAAATAAAAVEAVRKPLPAGKRVYVPVSIKRAVWARSGGRCEVKIGARRCTSRYLLQLDHFTPLALGGTNELKNFRLACRSHNLQQAREKLGGRPSYEGKT